MLQILKIIFGDCEVGISNDPVHGFSAVAKGPFAVLALILFLVVALYIVTT